MILSTLFSLIIIAFICSIITKFLLYLIGDPWDEQVNSKAIFSFIGKWIDEGYNRAELSIKNQYTQKNWFMALGACYYCLNVYVSALFGFLACLHFDLNLWYLIAILPMSHYSLHYVMK